jgi:hypothetical protein
MNRPLLLVYLVLSTSQYIRHRVGHTWCGEGGSVAMLKFCNVDCIFMHSKSTIILAYPSIHLYNFVIFFHNYKLNWFKILMHK